MREAFEPGRRAQAFVGGSALVSAHLTASSGFTNLNTGTGVDEAGPDALNSWIRPCESRRREQSANARPLQLSRLREQQVETLGHALDGHSAQLRHKLVLCEALRNASEHAAPARLSSHVFKALAHSQDRLLLGGADGLRRSLSRRHRKKKQRLRLSDAA